MANHKSADKRHRQGERKRRINTMNRHKLKTQLKKMRSATGSEDAAKQLPTTYSMIDKAVQKGVIKKNAAARYKSRLARASTHKAA